MTIRATCTGCGARKRLTNRGLLYLHKQVDGRACPGAAKLPAEAAAPDAIGSLLRALVARLPVQRWDGEPVVRLHDLTATVERAALDAAAVGAILERGRRG